jgi:hypothetical protein
MTHDGLLIPAQLVVWAEEAAAELQQARAPHSQAHHNRVTRVQLKQEAQNMRAAASDSAAEIEILQVGARILGRACADALPSPPHPTPSPPPPLPPSTPPPLHPSTPPPRPQASQAELLDMLATSQRDAAAARDQEGQLAAARGRVKELEAAAAAGQLTTGAGLASEMEFLRKERRAEVEQVEQEWRRRWQELQAQNSELRSLADACNEAAARAAERHASDVEAAR